MEKNQDFIYTDWILIEPNFRPEKLHNRETIFTIGNGYLGTRGSFEEGYPCASPATFIHGVYDPIPPLHTEMTNCPDCLPLLITIEGDRFGLDQGTILQYNRELDLRQGILSRSLQWRSPSGKTIDIYFERFASMADHHVLCQRCTLTFLDFHGRIELQSGINGYPENRGFNHWERLEQGKLDQGFWLHSRNRQSRLDMGIAGKISLLGVEGHSQVNTAPSYPGISATFRCSPNQTITIDKIITLFTSRDVPDPLLAASSKLHYLPDYVTLYNANQQEWNQIWQQSDILIEGDSKAAFAVRYNLFKILIAVYRYDNKVSIPPKTISAFFQHSYMFWDAKIFILPFLIFTQPIVARNLLNYRYYILAADLDKPNEAYQRFMQTAMLGLEEVMESSIDATHGASAGAVWQAVVFGFGGIQFIDDQPVAYPHLPPGWTRLQFKLYWYGQWHNFDLHPGIVTQKKSRPIGGIIFDLDGVLIDTCEYHYQSWQKLANEEKIPFNREINESLQGISDWDFLISIIGDRQYSEFQLREIMERRNRYYIQLIQNITPDNLLPGVKYLIDDLRRVGLKIGLGSSSKNARLLVEKLGIGEEIDSITDGYNVSKPKPAPDLFLFAAQQLGVIPRQCVVFEDGASGIDAALAAGMWVVGIGSPERVGSAHIVVPNLVGMTWEKLHRKLQDLA
jgi:beta-phosphoglucomutase